MELRQCKGCNLFFYHGGAPYSPQPYLCACCYRKWEDDENTKKA